VGGGAIVAPLEAADRADWQRLAERYKAFYATPTAPAEYDAAWTRLTSAGPTHGLGAKLDGRLVGIAHYLFHASAWTDRVCYLQDLFTAEGARGRGVAGALIDAVARRARDGGATRLYWLTQSHNATARALYDRVAEHRGFIRYDHPLD
jgi:GNAT superfamily N-acetyltransferase